MLDMTTMYDVTCDNSIVINGIKFMVNDDIAMKCLSIINGANNMLSNTPAPAPKKEYKPIEADFEGTWWIKDNLVKPVTKDGAYIGEARNRKPLNAKLREAGFIFDKDVKAYALMKNGKRDIVGAQKFVDNTPCITTIAEQQAVRDKAVAREARKK